MSDRKAIRRERLKAAIAQKEQQFQRANDEVYRLNIELGELYDLLNDETY